MSMELLIAATGVLCAILVALLGTTWRMGQRIQQIETKLDHALGQLQVLMPSVQLHSETLARHDERLRRLTVP